MELLERVGAYAGLAGFLGLAILALLYFSQARDVRRLREWAGRAPERAAEIPPAGVTDAGQAPTQTQTAPLTPAAQHGLPPLSLAESQAKKRKPLRERLRNVHLPPARYLAVAAMVLLLAGGGLFAATQLVGEGDGGESSETARDTGSARDRADAGGDGGGSATPNVDPARVTVAVLNGTTVQGLAALVGEEVRAGGFTLGTIGNAARIDQGTTKVLYRQGEQRAARAVAGQLGLKSTAPVDQVNEEIAGSFDVVVLVGSDRSS